MKSGLPIYKGPIRLTSQFETDVFEANGWGLIKCQHYPIIAPDLEEISAKTFNAGHENQNQAGLAQEALEVML